MNWIYFFLRGVGASGLASFAWLMGWRNGVLRRQLQIISRNHGASRAASRISVTRRVKRFALLNQAARDLLDLLLVPNKAHGLTLHPASASELAALQKGPALFLTAHFHNWEFLGSWLTRQGVPLKAIAKPLAQGWAQRLITSQRKKLQLSIFERKGDDFSSARFFRQVLAHTQSGGVVGMLWDQHPPGAHDIGKFWGAPVKLDPLPGFLIKHVPMPVFFGALLPNGEVRLIRLIAKGQPFEKLTRRYHRCLEVLIAMHPHYAYTLLHRRFRDTSS